MSKFKAYMHLERFGTSGVRGIEEGRCYIFPKLDGTNASVWMEDGQVQFGSRKRHLKVGEDNAGFLADNCDDAELADFLNDNPSLTVFGEWLVPHALKTYVEGAWRKFYVFDVYNRGSERYLSYPEYSQLFNKYSIELLRPMVVIDNPTVERLIELVEDNTYMIKAGEGTGEGIVIKNYDYINQWGRILFAKILSESFTGEKIKAGKKIGGDGPEQKIAEYYVTTHLVSKCYVRVELSLEDKQWTGKCIPMLLNMVYHDIIDEEMWDMLKRFKVKELNFRMLQSMITMQIKKLKPELF